MSGEMNYTIKDLFEMLKTDESWESDPKMREEIANAFYSSIQFL